MKTKNLLTTEQASEYLKNNFSLILAPGTLSNLRCKGKGPNFVRISRLVFYKPEDLDKWASKRLSQTGISRLDYFTGICLSLLFQQNGCKVPSEILTQEAIEWAKEVLKEIEKEER